MASCIYLDPLGRLHMCPIQLYLLALWRAKIHPLTHMIVIRPILLQHLQWWMNRENFFKGMPLQDPPSQLTLITDASEHGRGAHIENWETAGIWPHQYQQKHKLVRTEGCAISSSRSSIFDKGESYPYTIRQHNSAFPPPILVPKVLHKLREETSVVLLIAPMWPRQSLPSDIQSSDRYTRQVTTVARSSVSKSQSEFSSKSRDSQSCSMETVKLRHKSKGFSEEIADIMANARKTPTRTVYDARLRIYNSCCKEQGVNPITTSIPELAEFFMYLFNVRKCKPQTIAGYKSAIAIILQNGSSVGINTELSSLLKGLFNKYPSTRQLTPNWNLPLVLLALTKHPFEPLESADLKFLTLKTVFLVTIASASRNVPDHQTIFAKAAILDSSKRGKQK
uniref:Core-binding (CB) domain-containing protein n=1 Tax=Magallana gigas TaxID=29159 RepID=A0A8W8N4W1_MAGGI